MLDAWVSGLAFSLFFVLLAGLQTVSAPEVPLNCDFLNCPRGFKCCDNICCLEDDFFSGPLRIFIIIFLVVVPLLCICCLVKRFCRCRKPEQDPVTDHPGPPNLPSPPPAADRVWIATLDCPPPYSEVVMKPTMGSPPTEPPPPYSVWPEDHAGMSRGIDNPAF